MAALEVTPKVDKSTKLNLIYFTLVNAAVLWVFVKRPFINEYMNHELSRFFW